MVSADNLNLDVLSLVFAFITTKDDLASVALVSRSFLAAVTPRLYSALYFTLRQAKRYPKLMTPFATIVAHPHLAIHVRRVEIRCIPTVKSQLHPGFMNECTTAISKCSNLAAFKCSLNVTPLFLRCFQGKENLSSLRLNGNISTDASKQLIGVRNLNTLAIDQGSWNLLDVLPSWTSSMNSSLTSLTLYNCAEVNDCILKPILHGLPTLAEFNVVGCPRIDHTHVLHLLHLTPNLERLAFTLTENPCTPDFKPFTLRQLKHLALDAKCCMLPSPFTSIVSAVIGHINTASSSLVSFTAKLGDRSSVPDFAEALLSTHALTLRSVAFVGCAVDFCSISRICRSCPHLERLDISLPIIDLILLTDALKLSPSLRTLVDLGDSSHAAHGPRISLTTDSARHMMSRVRRLNKIVSSGRVWKRKRGPENAPTTVILDHTPGYVPEKYWFLLRE